ncbi:MBOAT family O-acyltransferase [Leptospira ryugenii]|uniref:MBOAT family O-acyltransferase n=1 Tax=Leptospira ryugenii TaxID=1917863 RepID=UPI001FCEB08F|nr:MBOAT family O-acyltransferase [Leptospira ryugenii]
MWNWRYLGLIIWIASVDFFLAHCIHREDRASRKKILLYLSLANSLGILFFFKYFFFFHESLGSGLGLFGLSLPWQGSTWSLLLPVGISFYTFQSIAYVSDVYRGLLKPERNFLRYLLFLSFFPQLVAGPIVSARSMLPQLRRFLPLPRLPWREAFTYICLGVFKKAVLADHIAPFVDLIFESPEEMSRIALWLGMFAYAAQIYCDFSGYTDIAQGSALMFGVRLPENFNFPYLALGFSDFWRRWHISLSTWLRLYLYIPLGGNRQGNLRTYVNLMIVMLLGGLWHGANWNFMFWGFGHGFLLVMERYLGSKRDWVELWKKKVPSSVSKVSLQCITFLSVCFLWIFFRSQTFSKSLCYLQGLFVENGQKELPYLVSKQALLCVVVLFLGLFCGGRCLQIWKRLSIESGNNTNVMRQIAFGALFSLSFIVLVLLSAEGTPFVYFVF